jgi:hypothetical protein
MRSRGLRGGFEHEMVVGAILALNSGNFIVRFSIHAIAALPPAGEGTLSNPLFQVINHFFTCRSFISSYIFY